MLNADVLSFFEGESTALSLYEQLERRICEFVPELKIKVGKSQVSFYAKKMFGCVSMMRLGKKAELPEEYIVATFGLGEEVRHPRIAVATEAYPGRWTHHVIVSRPEELDEQLIGWLREAYVFSEVKGRR